MIFDRLSGFLDSVPTFGAPGVDCIVQQDGKTIFRHWAGLADREAGTPMTGKERFNLYSCTKPITCAAALQLMEQGKFLLTDPVSDYLPEFKDMTVEHWDERGMRSVVPAEAPITIRHLFTMTAGLNYQIDTPAIKDAVAASDGKAPTRQIVRAIASQPLSYQPGSSFRYSLAHDVLAALIEVLSGMRFGEYLQKNIFEPLGMRHTGFARDAKIESEMMQQYTYDAASGSITPNGRLTNPFVFGPEYESGGAGLISTVDDCVLFATAMARHGEGANGARILHPATVDLMRLNQLDENQNRLFNKIWKFMVGYGYGLGVRTMCDKAKSCSLGPVGEFGWSGAAGCYTIFDPENRIALFYAQHMRPGLLEPLVHPRIRNLLYSSL